MHLLVIILPFYVDVYMSLCCVGFPEDRDAIKTISSGFKVLGKVGVRALGQVILQLVEDVLSLLQELGGLGL